MVTSQDTSSSNAKLHFLLNPSPLASWLPASLDSILGSLFSSLYTPRPLPSSQTTSS